MRILTVDGNNLCHRVYYVANNLPYHYDNLHVYMFLNSIKSYVNMYQPDKIYCAWDEKPEPRVNKRCLILPEYKQNRDKEKNTTVHAKNGIIKDILTFLAIPSIYPRDYEADDVMAIIDTHIPHDRHIIVTVDRDMCQLISPKTVVYDAIRKIEINESNFVENIKYTKDQFIQAKALAGDKGDNIPGIKGFGAKKIKKYLNNELELTVEQKELLARNIQLVSLVTNGEEAEYVVNQLKTTLSPDWSEFKNVVERYGLNSISSKYDEWYSTFFQSSRLFQILA